MLPVSQSVRLRGRYMDIYSLSKSNNTDREVRLIRLFKQLGGSFELRKPASPLPRTGVAWVNDFRTEGQERFAFTKKHVVLEFAFEISFC
jgi:hypothetical protein